LFRDHKKRSRCQGNSKLIILLYRASVEAAEVAHLKDTLMAQQQIGGLKITMENPVVVEMSDSSKKLNHQSLYFS